MATDIDQIDEKLWTQRMPSDGPSDAHDLRSSTLHGSSTGDPFIEENNESTKFANEAPIRKLLWHTPINT